MWSRTRAATYCGAIIRSIKNDQQLINLKLYTCGFFTLGWNVKGVNWREILQMVPIFLEFSNTHSQRLKWTELINFHIFPKIIIIINITDLRSTKFHNMCSNICSALSAWPNSSNCPNPNSLNYVHNCCSSLLLSLEVSQPALSLSVASSPTVVLARLSGLTLDAA